jgi:hypothetical protein
MRVCQFRHEGIVPVRLPRLVGVCLRRLADRHLGIW